MKIDKNYAAYWLIVVVIFCLLSMGCASRKPALLPPVYAGVASDYDSVRTDRTEHVQHDSIYIFEKETIYQKGDTVYQDRWHTVYKSVIDKRTDTLYVDVVKTDTVRVVVQVPAESHSLPLGKRILVCLGGIAFLLIIGCVGWFTMKLMKP